MRDEQGEGRHGGLPQRPHKPPPRAPGVQIRAELQSPGGGVESHLGVQDGAEFQSHCVIAERLSGEREHTVQGPHLESIWDALPTGERAGEARTCSVGRPGVGSGSAAHYGVAREAG